VGEGGEGCPPGVAVAAGWVGVAVAVGWGDGLAVAVGGSGVGERVAVAVVVGALVRVPTGVVWALGVCDARGEGVADGTLVGRMTGASVGVGSSVRARRGKRFTGVGELGKGVAVIASASAGAGCTNWRLRAKAPMPRQ